MREARERPITRPAPALRSLQIALFAILFAVMANAVDLPPVPPLPTGTWPAPEVAEPFARALMASVPAAALAQTLRDHPDAVPAILRNLGTALLSSDPSLRDRLAAFVVDVAAASARSIDLNNPEDLHRMAALAVVDPLRYGEDPAFRRRIDALLPRMAAANPRPVARRLLDELTKSAALDFETAEAFEVAARLAMRSSSTRQVPFDRASLVFPDDLSGPIEASIYSLDTPYFTPAEAERFLTAVHTVSPARRLVVLAGTNMREALEPLAKRLRLTVVDEHARRFTPWPRDPFLVARTSAGGVVLVNRPNLQPHREEDANMARALVRELPSALDDTWKARWTVAPAPFHNGNILLAPTAVWITIHSVEPRALEILGADHVPVETFNERTGIDRYVAAVRQAARELEALYRRPVRFVHPLPGAEPLAQATALMTRLGGGAGFDLDSIVTILPRAGGKPDALVAGIALGITAARQAAASEWTAVRSAYGFRAGGDALRREIIATQASAPAVALGAFLDEVASMLQREGMNVRRLPLLNVPASLLAREDVPRDTAFLMTWNNVVLEKRGNSRRAEGFASLLPNADQFAKQAFAASGYRLDLFPPLINSIVLGGGYRCASNHVRPAR